MKFVFEIRAVYETLWKRMVEPDCPQMIIQYGSCALHAEGLQTHAQNM